jgi:phosphopantothenate synthetase
MVHWPKSIYGNALLFLATLSVVGIAGQVAAAVPGSLLAASAAAVALTSVGLFVWRRRVEARRERAWVGQFSFGDVVARMHAREATA